MISTITKNRNHPFFHDNTNDSYENTINIMQNFFESEFEKYYKKHKNLQTKKTNFNINETIRTFHSHLRQTRRLKNSFLTRKRKFPHHFGVESGSSNKIFQKTKGKVNQTFKLVKNDDILKVLHERFSNIDAKQNQTNMKIDLLIQNAKDIFHFNNNNYTNCFERTEKINTTSAFHPSATLCWEKDQLGIYSDNFEYLSKNTIKSITQNNNNTIEYFSFRIKPEMTLNFTAENMNMKMNINNINEITNKNRDIDSSPNKLKNYLEDSKIQEEIDNSLIIFRSLKEDEEDEKIKPFNRNEINSEIYMYKQNKFASNSLEDLNINVACGVNANDTKDNIFSEKSIKLEEVNLFNKDELSVNAYSELELEKRDLLDEKELISFNQQNISISTNNNDNQSEFSNKTDMNAKSKGKYKFNFN